MAIDYSKSYSCSWRLVSVDPATWADGRAVSRVVSATVERDATDGAPLLESLTAAVSAEPGAGFPAGWYRLQMDASQGAEAERVDVCTAYVESTGGEAENGEELLDVSGRSVLQPAKDSLLLMGTYAPKGCDGAAWAARMLSGCLAAPVTAEGSFTLGDHAVFGAGVSRLEAAWTLLGAAGWCIQLDGRGNVALRPKPSEASWVLDGRAKSLLMPSARRTLDLSEVPNAYHAVSGADTASAVNDDPASEVSTASRGWEKAVLDEDPVRIDGETLAAYCARKLAEASSVTEEFAYSREHVAGLRPFDVVAGKVAEFGMDGAFRVLKQTVECGNGMHVAETVGKEVALWR